MYSQMLMKPQPIQRLCKYPLLLQELLKWTHIQDDPTAHDGIHQALEGVRAMINQINNTAGNPVNKGMVQRTLFLQEMLRLPKLVSNWINRNPEGCVRMEFDRLSGCCS